MPCCIHYSIEKETVGNARYPLRSQNDHAQTPDNARTMIGQSCHRNGKRLLVLGYCSIIVLKSAVEALRLLQGTAVDENYELLNDVIFRMQKKGWRHRSGLSKSEFTIIVLQISKSLPV